MTVIATGHTTLYGNMDVCMQHGLRTTWALASAHRGTQEFMVVAFTLVRPERRVTVCLCACTTYSRLYVLITEQMRTSARALASSDVRGLRADLP